jgi:DNA-binding NarL/FixJ family response regulator
MKKTKPFPKSKKPQKKRILLVEDHPMTRMGLKMMIAGEPGLEVCGEAAHAGEALDAAISLQPDLVLTMGASPQDGALAAASVLQSSKYN